MRRSRSPLVIEDDTRYRRSRFDDRSHDRERRDFERDARHNRHHREKIKENGKDKLTKKFEGSPGSVEETFLDNLDGKPLQPTKEKPKEIAPSAGTSDDRINRLEKLVELLVNKTASSSGNSERHDVAASTSYSTSYDDIPELIPRNPNFTTSMWLNRIDEICMERNFDERTTILFTQQRMSGVIKTWFKTLQTFDFTWQELKLLLAKLFPDNVDFAATLRLLVNREKQPLETMTEYYFSKMYLLEACKISGTNAVSCLIDGLPNQYMKQMATSYNFLTPEAVYSDYLSTFPETFPSYQDQPRPEVGGGAADVVEPSPPRSSVVQYNDESFDVNDEEEEDDRPHSPLTLRYHPNRGIIRCHTCKKFGHKTAKCRTLNFCYICKKRGHLSDICRYNKDNILLCQNQNYDSCQKNTKNTMMIVNCQINDSPLVIDGLIDTGCDLVVMKKSVYDQLELPFIRSSKIMRGFGGGAVSAICETKLQLTVDLVTSNVEVVVVPDEKLMVDLLVGQTFLQQKNVVMLMQAGRMRLFLGAVTSSAGQM